jgi:hypothetical protein
MTAEHCSYCDGHPLNATGIETVDHFRPKSRPEFYNRADACSSRKRTVRFARRLDDDGDADDVPYRYLLPLCRVD